MIPFLRCASCHDLLHHPTTLPCGFTVCLACVKPPTCSQQLIDLESQLAVTFASNTLPAAMQQQIRTYRCPARACRARHLGRPVPDWVLTRIVEAMFPFETRVLSQEVVNVDECVRLGLQAPLVRESRARLLNGDFIGAVEVARVAHQ
ncbi:hypothetical protein HDU98_004138, partial [Podochytrium sp. JEL0797]